MKLATIRQNGTTYAAVETGSKYTIVDGYADVGELLTEPNWHTIAEQASGATQEVLSADLAPVVSRPGKIFCVGLNYRSHILEMGRELPEYPTLFSKYAETLIGAGDTIEVPHEDDAIDWEAELAVIIGKSGRRIAQEDAADHIAGYAVCNDISMRTWQFRTIEWLQGKNWENSTPLGPTLVTPDEWQPGGTIRTIVDGEVMQEASTADLVHGPEELIAYISTMITLQPGDVIITGTPGGVGHGRDPKCYLQPGQTVETSIEGLGTLRNLVAAPVVVNA